MKKEIKLRDKTAILHLYDKIMPELAAHINQNLAAITPLFQNFPLERVIDIWTKDPDADENTPISIENGNVQQMALRLRLEGFQQAGVPPFDLSKDLLFKLNRTWYSVGPDKLNDWLERGYLQPWTEKETRAIAKKWGDEVIDEITQRLEGLV